MCGIYGSITKQTTKLTAEQKLQRAKVLSSMALAMQDRGTDSTGLATINKKTVKIVKKAKPAIDFIKDEDFKQAIGNGFKITIGHTRLATVGIIDDKNAHPFKRGAIIGCHNGSVTNWREWEDEGKLKVDSEAIFYLLNKNKNDYKKTFKELNGSFAIAWADLNDQNAIYLTAHNNPLYVIRVSEIDTIFFLSEEYYLQAIINTAFGIDKKDIFRVKDDTVYRISPKLNINRYKVNFNEYSYNSGYGYNGYNTNYQDNYANSYASDDDLDQDTPIKSITEYKGKTIIEYDTKDVNDEEYENLLKEEDLYYRLCYPTCDECLKPLEVRTGFWINEDIGEMLCGKCITYGEAQNGSYKWLVKDDYDELCQLYTSEHNRLLDIEQVRRQKETRPIKEGFKKAI